MASPLNGIPARRHRRHRRRRSRVRRPETFNWKRRTEGFIMVFYRCKYLPASRVCAFTRLFAPLQTSKRSTVKRAHTHVVYLEPLVITHTCNRPRACSHSITYSLCGGSLMQSMRHVRFGGKKNSPHRSWTKCTKRIHIQTLTIEYVGFPARLTSLQTRMCFYLMKYGI